MNQFVTRSKNVVIGMSNAAMLQALGQKYTRPYVGDSAQSLLASPEPLFVLDLESDGLGFPTRAAFTFATPFGAHLAERSFQQLADGVVFGFSGWLYGAETPFMSLTLDAFFSTSKTGHPYDWRAQNLFHKQSRQARQLQEALDKVAARFVEADDFGYPAMVRSTDGTGRVVWLDSCPEGVVSLDASAWLDAGKGRFTLKPVTAWMASETPVSRPVSNFALAVLYRALQPKRVAYLDGHYALTESLNARERLARRVGMMAQMYGLGMSGNHPH